MCQPSDDSLLSVAFNEEDCLWQLGPQVSVYDFLLHIFTVVGESWSIPSLFPRASTTDVGDVVWFSLWFAGQVEQKGIEKSGHLIVIFSQLSLALEAAPNLEGKEADEHVPGFKGIN